MQTSKSRWTYIQAVSDEKRKAQRKVIEMIMPAFARQGLMDDYLDAR